MQLLSLQSLNDVHGLGEADRPIARPLLGRLRAALVALWRRSASRRSHLDAVWELHQLDDRMLNDIGISRCEIEAAVRGLPLRNGRTL